MEKIGAGTVTGEFSMRISTRMDDVYAESIWAQLKSGLQIILKTSGPTRLSFEDLYRSSFTMVLHHYSERLYNGVREVIYEHLVNLVRVEITSSLQNNFLQVLSSCWNDHQRSMAAIRSILGSLDSHYVRQNNVENVYDLGLIIFRDTIISDEQIAHHLKQTLLSMIARDRRGEVVLDRGALKDAYQMLIGPGIHSRKFFEEHVESAFLSDATDFYRTESQKLLERAETNASLYFIQLETYIDVEQKRAQYCYWFDKTVMEHVVAILETELIRKHMTRIIEVGKSCVIHMNQKEQADDLARMLQLLGLSQNEGLKKLKTQIRDHIIEQGKYLITEDNANPNAMHFIQNLLNFKQRFLSDSLSDNRLIKLRLMIVKGLEHFISLNTNAPEYLSIFIDDRLRRGVKIMSEQEFEGLLDDAMILFRLMQEKDVFERYYQQHFAKRLLDNTRNSDDSEKNMILRIKIECGSLFTVKLERMLGDITISDNLKEEFKELQAHNSATDLHAVDLSVQVLTTGSWPFPSAASQSKIPSCVSIAYESFKSFYLGKHTGRRLTLQSQHGTADLLATFYGSAVRVKKPMECTASTQDGDASSDLGLETAVKEMCVKASGKGEVRNHILQVSTYQMIVLMLFNTKESWTYKDIMSETDIPEQDLMRAIQSLAQCKIPYRVLSKNPKTKEIEPDHVFTVNDQIASKLHRIKIKTVSAKEDTDAELKDTRHKVDENRRHDVDAAIVRIMKAHQELGHNALVAEVIKQLKARFIPSPVMIKIRVESLIDREYLQRTAEDRSVYTYVK